MRLRIRNGRVIDPKNGVDAVRDLLIRDGRIAVDQEDPAEADQTIDAEGMIVCPGFVDVHAHFRDPGQTEKETLETGSLAAAAGGYTSVILMANTIPAVDNAERYRDVMLRAEKTAVKIYQLSSVTEDRAGKRLVDMEALQRAGVRGFTDDGSPITDGELVMEAMKKAAKLHLPLSFHEEHPDFVKEAGVNSGKEAQKLGLTGADRQAEIVMVRRDLEYALETGAIIDIQHVSCAESVELIRQAKKKDPGGLIHAEATPHHFSLTEEAVSKYGTNAKVNPPLRTEEDRLAIIEGLKDGTLDLIATDHAPHTREQKERDFTKAPSGMTGLQTALPLALEHLVKPGILSFTELIRLLSVNPAGLYGLEGGSLGPGDAADITIFDPDLQWRFSEETNYSRSGNSPFFQTVLTGRVTHTIVDGKEVFRT